MGVFPSVLYNNCTKKTCFKGKIFYHFGKQIYLCITINSFIMDQEKTLSIKTRNILMRLSFYKVYRYYEPYPFIQLAEKCLCTSALYTLSEDDMLILVDCIRNDIPDVSVFLASYIKKGKEVSDKILNEILKCGDDGKEYSYNVLLYYILYRKPKKYLCPYSRQEQNKADDEFRAKVLNILATGLEKGIDEAGRCLNLYTRLCSNDALLYDNGILDRVVICFEKGLPRAFDILLGLLKKYRDAYNENIPETFRYADCCDTSIPAKLCDDFWRKHQETLYQFYKKGLPFADSLFRKFCKFFLYHENNITLCFY